MQKENVRACFAGFDLIFSTLAKTKGIFYLEMLAMCFDIEQKDMTTLIQMPSFENHIFLPSLCHRFVYIALLRYLVHIERNFVGCASIA